MQEKNINKEKYINLTHYKNIWFATNQNGDGIYYLCNKEWIIFEQPEKFTVNGVKDKQRKIKRFLSKYNF